MSDEILAFNRIDLSQPRANKFIVLANELSEDLASFMEEFESSLPELLKAADIVDYENSEAIYDALAQYCEENGLSVEDEDDEDDEGTAFPVFITHVTRLDFGSDYRILVYIVGESSDEADEDEDSADSEGQWD